MSYESSMATVHPATAETEGNMEQCGATITHRIFGHIACTQPVGACRTLTGSVEHHHALGDGRTVTWVERGKARPRPDR